MTTQELTQDTQKYITNRNYMIKQVEKEKKQFKFADFSGSYNDYLKTLRMKFDTRITKYKEDIEAAILLDETRTKNYKVDF